MAKRKINIEDLFTEEREEKGVWFEPRIRGIPVGIEFLVTGTDTDKNVVNGERYEKALMELEDIKDPVEKVNKQKKLEADRVAEFVIGVRAAKDCEASFGGKPLEYSVPFIQELFKEAPLIKIEVARFAKDTSNFMKREKNA